MPLLSLLLPLFGLALASPGLEAVSQGDRAWLDGDRRAARDHFDAATESGEPAAEAMAHSRLLHFRGNLGPLVHGPRLDEALERAEGPWGELAWVDYHLFAPEAVGARKGAALERAENLYPRLPGPAAARAWLVSRDEIWLQRLEAAVDRDGLGEGILAHGGRGPEGPGTWYLGLGLGGAPGLGISGALLLRHPDVAWRGWWLGLDLMASSRGSMGMGLSLRGPGSLHLRGGAGLSRTVGDLYDGGTVQVFRQEQFWTEWGPGARVKNWVLWASARVRVDDVGDGEVVTAGPAAGLAWDRRQGRGMETRGTLVSLSGDWAIEGEHLGLFADLRAFQPALGGVMAARLTYRQELNDEAEFYLWPSAGGAEFHRGARTGRWRAPAVATFDLEQRWMKQKPLEWVVFVDGAWVQSEGFHPGVGTGLRIVLPPEDYNVVRLDLAFSDTGWGLSGAWGETF